MEIETRKKEERRTQDTRTKERLRRVIPREIDVLPVLVHSLADLLLVHSQACVRDSKKEHWRLLAFCMQKVDPKVDVPLLTKLLARKVQEYF